MKSYQLIGISIIVLLFISACEKGVVEKEQVEKKDAGNNEQAEPQETETPPETPGEQGGETAVLNETEEPKETSPEESQKMAFIEIRDMNFMPRDISVAVGTTVVWKHLDTSFDNMRHAITIYQQVQGKPFLYRETFNHTFNEIGAFKYTDSIYKEYISYGTITVHE